MAVIMGLGLTWSAEPSLPEGLGGESPANEPALPMGLSETNVATQPSDQKKSKEKTGLPIEYKGFFDGRGGLRVGSDPYQKNMSIGELRFHNEVSKRWDSLSVNVSGDFLLDTVEKNNQFSLEGDPSWFDLREANMVFRPISFLDVKIGRQILTWGTGDFIFINDLFPKDWNSFFIGRDLEYLKAPSDALKFSFFTEIANLDLVYTPKFNPDRFIDGRRISYFSIVDNEIAGRNNPVNTDDRSDWFSDDELSLRLYRQFNAHMIALYYYSGFWKSPSGFDMTSQNFTFPKLNVYGASYRGPIGKAIVNFELGYYDSPSDGAGDDPFIRNSEWRMLMGYERELKKNLRVSFQYYVERMDNYDDYIRTFPIDPLVDEYRQLATLRLTQLLLDQNMTLSLFNFWGVSDQDGFLKASANYKFSDDFHGELGGNWFYGKNTFSFFGQFTEASNIYAGFRYYL